MFDEDQPWLGGTGTSGNSIGQTISNFWGSLTNNIMGAGQQYFLGQQQINANITQQQITSNTITTVVKFVAVILVVGGIIKALISRRK